MALGGKRPGAGRKKGSSTKEALAYRELLLKRVEEEKGELIDALIAKAKTGDIAALKEINERTMGKVVQPIGGENGGPIILTWKSKSTMNLEDGPNVSISA
jgi:hypothetical protein